MLDTEIDSKVNVPDTNLTVGMEGKTISRLAPAGKAVFETSTEEVFSQHEFIDENQQVIITKIEGSKIIVKLKK
jgi:membrane-bound ClpP family serine protease